MDCNSSINFIWNYVKNDIVLATNTEFQMKNLIEETLSRWKYSLVCEQWLSLTMVTKSANILLSSMLNWVKMILFETLYIWEIQWFGNILMLSIVTRDYRIKNHQIIRKYFGTWELLLRHSTPPCHSYLARHCWYIIWEYILYVLTFIVWGG